MINSHIQSEDYNPPSTYIVEQLVRAATVAMEQAAGPDNATPSEVLSACFTLLDRMLRATGKLQAAEDRASNAREIHKVLQEMLVEFGSLPN